MSEFVGAAQCKCEKNLDDSWCKTAGTGWRGDRVRIQVNAGATGEGDGDTIATTTRRNPVPFTSTLMKNPKTLHVLWQEYGFGVGGRKAARDFLAKERGAVKFTFN